jgi:hypothetical protein
MMIEIEIEIKQEKKQEQEQLQWKYINSSLSFELRSASGFGINGAAAPN